MKILAFAASHRPESLNYKLVSLASKQAKNFGVEVELARYSEFDMPLYNDTLAEKAAEISKKFVEKCAGASAIIIATPEYNWSFPASLKNIIDWTSRIKPTPLSGKTVLLMSATTGARGGIVGMQQLKTPMESQNMFVFNKVFPLPNAQNAFAMDGSLIDKTQEGLLSDIIKDYISYTKKLTA